MDHTLFRGESMKFPCVRFTVRRIAVTATICVAAFGGISSQVMSRGTDIRAQMKEFYGRWVGVRAPELGQAGRDQGGKLVTLSSFRGKRVLLFSFDAGEFGRAADEKALLANLRALDRAINTAGRDKVAVIGFTQGMQFVWPTARKPEGELGKLSDFPVVSASSTALRKFNDPYNLMLQPGAILIDSQGILRAFYDHPLTERELVDAVALGDWDKPVRPVPVEDPWSGKEPPKPTHTATIAWARTIPTVAGMTGGDWDLRGSDDLILAAMGKLLVLDPVDGRELHMFPHKDILEGLTYTLGWARVGKDKSAAFLTRGGWPDEVPVVGRDGAPLWRLGYFLAGIDSVAWADLDGAGEKTLIVGLNGGGLETFFDGGRKRWSLKPEGNTWTVAGIDARGGRPGLVIFSNGDKVSIVDSKGAGVGTIPTDGHDVVILAASEVDGAGERQVVSVWPANVGTADYAVATDVKGKVLWKYPVNVDAMVQMGPAILAVDVTGDGTKEWIIAPNRRELVVLDTRGHLVARIEAADKGFPAWTAIERKGKPGWIVAEEAGKVSAFSLAPKN
jgi:hypothetical protein